MQELSYAALDPDHAYAWNAVHTTMMALTLLVIGSTPAAWRQLRPRPRRQESRDRFVSAYTAILAGVSLCTLMLVSNAL